MKVALIMEPLLQKLIIINLKLHLRKIFPQTEDMLRLNFPKIGMRMLQGEILPLMQFMRITMAICTILLMEKKIWN